MFSKAVASTVLLALAAAAAPTGPASKCTTGPVQCCSSTISTITPTISKLLGFLVIDISSVVFPIGFTCDPITTIGTGSGATCTTEPVCCENNSFNGVFSFGCSPVDINA